MRGGTPPVRQKNSSRNAYSSRNCSKTLRFGLQRRALPGNVEIVADPAAQGMPINRLPFDGLHLRRIPRRQRPSVTPGHGTHHRRRGIGLALQRITAIWGVANCAAASRFRSMAGSWAHVSTPARQRPAASAASQTSSSTTPPREAFSTSAPGFSARKKSAPPNPQVANAPCCVKGT